LDFSVNRDSGLVVRQEDTFSIPGSNIIMWALLPFLRPYLPPSVDDVDV
jgi:hypothetical protein